jgi:hypothetical protein
MVAAAALLPIAGAALGGITGYRQSGGNIGSALLGAGLGAATPGAFRMAGQALGAGLLGRSALGQAALQKAAKGVALSQADKAILAAPAAAGLATGGLGLLATPALAGSPAAALAGPATTAAQAGAGLAGYRAPGEVDYSGMSGGAVPPVGTFGGGGTLSDPTQVLGPVGMAQRLETLKSAEAQRDAMRLLMPELFKASEARSKTEFQRQMAAAGIRQNILTAANMLERSQQAAQQMGLNAASQAGSALTQQYQYS